MTSSALDSLIPTVQPRWKRSVVASTSSLLSTTEDCQVCWKNGSNYRCPKCSIHYCSLVCYKNHGETCTESFYRTQVAQELEVQRRDKDVIHELLKRVHQQQQQQQQFHDCEATDMYEVPDPCSEDELQRIYQALERDEEIELSPAVQAAFERDIHAGQLNHIVKPWVPWWESSFAEVVHEDERMDCNGALDLDERILQIPSFTQLFSQTASPSLAFNLVSILHAVSQTLRLYGGPVNAQCPEAADNVVLMSPVLSKDMRYDSLQEVLMDHGSSYGDVAALLTNQRHVVHALLDAVAIFKAATKTSTDRARLRRIRKKLEFYLSWSRGVDLRSLSTDIQAWQDEWQLNGELRLLKLE